VFHLYFAKALGRKPYSLRTSDRASALEIQRRTESDVWSGERGIKRKTAERVRYSDLVRRFGEHKVAAGINPGTLRIYQATLNQFGTFMGSDLYVDAITPEVIEGYITHRRTSLRQCGTGLLKPKSLRNEVFILVALFNWAMDRDLLSENPMRRVPKPKVVKYDAPRALTFDEYRKLKAAIKNPVFSDLVDLYLLTGIRRADGCNITSENFDLVQMVATLPQHKQGTHKTIPIGQDLAAVVRRIVARVGEGQPIVQVRPHRLTSNFKKAREAAELPPSLTFHSLRHSFASWLAAAGTDFKTLQELIGHTSGAATQIYVHAFNPNKRSAIDKLRLPQAVNA
jgi:integrase